MLAEPAAQEQAPVGDAGVLVEPQLEGMQADELRRTLANIERERQELEAEKKWLEERVSASVGNNDDEPPTFSRGVSGAESACESMFGQNPAKPQQVLPPVASGGAQATTAVPVPIYVPSNGVRTELDITRNMLEQLAMKVDKLCDDQDKGRNRRLSSTGGADGMDMLNRAESEAHGKDENEEVLANSALAMAPPVQALIYLVAFAGIVFTLVFPALEKDHRLRRLDGSFEEAPERRLGGPAGGVIVAVCYSTLGAGLMALITSFLKQPILIGYILGGVLVGPVGLGLVDDYLEILTIMDLGLVLLLFMIGLEVDLHALINMNRMTCVTGLMQFPICAGIHLAAFYALQQVGVDFGHGKWSLGYLALFSGISSTMIVVKSLSHKMETDTGAGKFTLGILLFQDFWAFMMIASQSNIENPDFLDILKDFAFMGILIYVSYSYAKYVLPPIFQRASGSTELMLVLALAWCFFVCSIAVLPFVSLSIEVAAFIGGVSMATFPYNAELNSKIKYIRDYFITLYFVGIGMQIESPTPSMAITMGCIVLVVLFVRWVGIFVVAVCQGSGPRLAILATVNLSQCSEFGLVCCTIGRKLGHIDDETMSMAIWVFAILAMGASYLINYNHDIYHAIMHKARKMPCTRLKLTRDDASQAEDDEDAEERDVVILGFHKIAAALVAEFEHKAPQIMRKIHVIDHKTALAQPLANKNVKFSAGDVTSPDVLRNAQKGQVDLVLITIPDYTITGVSNDRLLTTAREVWPACHIIVIADDPKQIKRLYDKGANYVLATKKLSAERIADMLTEHYSEGLAGGELKHHLEYHRRIERKWSVKLIDLNLGPSNL